MRIGRSNVGVKLWKSPAVSAMVGDALTLKVYRYLLRLRGKKSGRLDPTIRWIADNIYHSRNAVAAAQRLKEHGFLDWIRRCQPIEGALPDEQQTEEIANATSCACPQALSSGVRRMLRKPSAFVRAVAEKLARQKKLHTGTIDEVIAEVANPSRGLSSRGCALLLILQIRRAVRQKPCKD